MHKVLQKYEDFNGETKERTLYFNLTKAEIVNLQLDSEHGVQWDLQEAIRMKDTKKLLDFIKKIVHAGYGIKSEDGEQFDKSPEIFTKFENSAAYSPLYLSLFENGAERGLEFIQQLLPKELIEEAVKQMDGDKRAAEKAELEKQYAPSARQIFDDQAPRTVNDAPIVDVNTTLTPEPAPLSAAEAEMLRMLQERQSNNQ